MNLFHKIKKSFTETRNFINKKLNNLFNNFKKIDKEFFEELEEILIEADLGVYTSSKIIENLIQYTKDKNIKDSEKIKELIKEIILEIMLENIEIEVEKFPKIIMVVGVNGVGKTTTIGKLAKFYKQKEKKILISAADTFRAAAIDQLKIWAEKTQTEIVSHLEGSDPSSVIFDSINFAKARNVDIIICDTAGRLHNKKNLMEELKKMKKIIEREENFYKEILLVIDATTGQNGVIQAKYFNDALNVDGVILTKIDGTAKGGITISIKDQIGIPVKYIGIGEKIDDISEFDAKQFIENIFN
ncbi:MAG: signal recognition particle-docking protein FtsY [Clostridiales bacterium]|jgi:fused signal recognition particle receptor|nr:signal recognition particle-docking protein FtsY [Clostridiales bacterium]